MYKILVQLLIATQVGQLQAMVECLRVNLDVKTKKKGRTLEDLAR